MKKFGWQIPKQWVVLLSLISLLFACHQSNSPNFAEDIAPIIHKNCSPCHQAGGAAPFSLITYTEVAKKGKMLAHVTKTRYMPPWPADRHYSSFINERFLSDEEINLIQAWVKGGKPPGDTARLKTVDWKASLPSVLGKPDLIVKLPKIAIKNDNRDQFYVVKIPVQLDQPRFVRAVEFIPGQTQYAHHVNGHYLSFSDQTNPFAGSRVLDIESQKYDSGFLSLQLLNKDGSLPFRVHSAVNYLPGAFGVKYPRGIGGFVMSRSGAFVANDLHYGPSRKNLIDSSLLYIYFSDRAPERPTYELMMGTNGVSEIKPPLSIPPNTISKHSSRITIYNTISVLTINPHMHLLGSKFKAYALKPNGDTLHLIHIPKWEFRWQYFYTFKNPLKIPKGSEIIVEAEFDNTGKNPNNPYNPPQLIGERRDRGGASMRTTDEMLQFIITYMPYREGDEKIDLSAP